MPKGRLLTSGPEYTASRPPDFSNVGDSLKFSSESCCSSTGKIAIMPRHEKETLAQSRNLTAWWVRSTNDRPRLPTEVRSSHCHTRAIGMENPRLHPQSIENTTRNR